MVSAIVAYLSVNELKKQRQESNQPTVLVNGSTYDIKIIQDNEIYRLHWKNELGESFSLPHVEVINAGRGVAQKIKFEWNFNVEKLVENINSLNSSIKCNYEDNLIIIERNGVPMGQKRNYGENVNYMIPYTDNPLAFKLDLPYEINTVIEQIQISMTELFNASTKTNLKNMNGSHLIRYDKVIPPLFLDVKYEDKYKRKYTSSFEVRFKAYSYMYGGEDAGTVKILCE